MLVVTLFLFVSITFHLISFGFRKKKKVISWSKYFQRNKNTSITIYKQLRYTDIHRPKYIFFTEKLRRFFCSHLHISLWYIFSLYFVFHHHIIILVVDMFSREGIKLWDGTKHFMLLHIKMTIIIFTSVFNFFIFAFSITFVLAKKCVIVVSNSCEKLYQVLSYPF